MKLIFEARKKYFIWFFFLYIKMTNNYYQKHKERFQTELRKKKAKIAQKRYQNFTGKETEKTSV